MFTRYPTLCLEDSQSLLVFSLGPESNMACTTYNFPENKTKTTKTKENQKKVKVRKKMKVNLTKERK